MKSSSLNLDIRLPVKFPQLNCYLITILLVIFPAHLDAGQCHNAIASEQATTKLKLIAIQYPEGQTFAEWLDRKSSLLSCELFKRLHWNVEIFHLPFRRAFAEMVNGTADMMAGADYIFKPKDRCNLKLVPYRFSRISAYYFDKQKHLYEPTKLEDFENKIIAVATPTAKTDKAFKKLGVNSEFYFAANHETLFHLLRHDRVDYALMSSSGAKKLLEKTGKHDNPDEAGEYFEVSTPFNIQKSGIVFQMNTPNASQLVRDFKLELNNLRREDIYTSIIDDDQSFLTDGEKTIPSLFDRNYIGIAKEIEELCNSK